MKQSRAIRFSFGERQALSVLFLPFSKWQTLDQPVIVEDLVAAADEAVVVAGGVAAAGGVVEVPRLRTKRSGLVKKKTVKPSMDKILLCSGFQ